MSSLLAGIILFLTVSTSLVLGILAGYGAVAGIIFVFAQKSGRAAGVAPALAHAKAIGAAAGQASGD